MVVWMVDSKVVHLAVTMVDHLVGCSVSTMVENWVVW